LFVAAMGLPIFAIAVYIMDFPRMYLYAALFVFCIIQSEFLIDYLGEPLNAVLCFGVPGLIILILGLSFLFKFMRKYPIQNPEASHVG
jgi:hypothetical protein